MKVNDIQARPRWCVYTMNIIGSQDDNIVWCMESEKNDGVR